jgi:DNA-binding GntR family transcriptional regulator
MTDINIDKRSKISYDKQVQQQLRSLIARGVLRKGTDLIEPRLLAKELDIETSMVESAYRLLEKEKRVTYQNESWKVSIANIPKIFFEEFISIYDSIIKNAKSIPSIKTLEIDLDKHVKGNIALSLGQNTALYCKRIYYGNEVPFVYANIYFPVGRFPNLEEELRKDKPYYKEMNAMYGVKLSKSTRTIKGLNLKKREADYLGVPEGTAAYLTVVKNFDEDGNVFEISEVYGISDVMHLTIEQAE